MQPCRPSSWRPWEDWHVPLVSLTSFPSVGFEIGFFQDTYNFLSTTKLPVPTIFPAYSMANR